MSKLSRKDFLKRSFVGSAALPFLSLDRLSGFPSISNEDIAKDEAFWGSIRKLYRMDAEVVNLNNGAVGPQSNAVQEAYIQMYRESNRAPSYSMWQKVDSKRENLRTQLGTFLGCKPEEVAVNRNTTEGISSIIFGLDLNAGDEVIVSNYDYPFALNGWKQRALRDGIVLKEVELNLPIEDKEAAISLYTDAITEKTKVVHLTHILNWTGQLIPVKEITKIAHEKGCLVVVDAAHSVGQIPFSFSDVGCDFAATSLHKWVGAPFGTGALMVKQSRIEGLWPLHSAYESKSTNIRKFEFLGTRSNAAEMAVIDALAFQQQVGLGNIQMRLNELRAYWMKQLKDVPEITFHTSFSSEFAAAMGTFSIDGKSASEMADYLMEADAVHVGKIQWNNLEAVRVSPHIYTSLDELDLFVTSVKKLISR